MQQITITINDAIKILQDLPQTGQADFHPPDVQLAIRQLTQGMQLLSFLTEVCERAIADGTDKRETEQLTSAILRRQEQVLEILLALTPVQ